MVGRRKLLQSGVLVATAALTGCLGSNPDTPSESRSQTTSGYPCAHLAQLKLDLLSSRTSTSSTEVNPESGVLYLDSDSLSERQQAILSEAITEEYGFDTCVDQEVPSELSELVQRLFEVDDDLQHFSSDTVIIRFDGNYYRAHYGVQVI